MLWSTCGFPCALCFQLAPLPPLCPADKSSESVEALRSLPLVRMIATAEPSAAGGPLGSKLGPLQAKRSLVLVNTGKLNVHVSPWGHGGRVCVSWSGSSSDPHKLSHGSFWGSAV
jgi:hypothetical protein